MYDTYLDRLEAGEPVSRPLRHGLKIDHLANWTPYLGPDWRVQAETGIPIDVVEKIGLALCEHPEHFRLHRVVSRLMAAAARDGARGTARRLGLRRDAGLRLAAPGRLLDTDVRAGLRARHLRPTATPPCTTRTPAAPGSPLAHLFDDQPPVEIINSLLSEEAVLGFEYGYSSSEPEGLIVWEGPVRRLR